MKKYSAQGFSLIELILAMVLSTFVMVLFTNGLMNIRTTLKKVGIRTYVDRVFDRGISQIDRDVSAICMPELAGLSKAKKPGKTDDEISNPYLLLESDDDRIRSFHFNDGDDQAKRINMLKKMTFLTTTFLPATDKKNLRLQRVVYELELDKKASNNTAESYQLYRTELPELFDKKGAKKDSDAEPERLLMMTMIRELSFEAMSIKVDPSGTEKVPKIEQVFNFSWGNAEASKGSVPVLIHMRIAVWMNDQLTESMPHEHRILLFAQHKAVPLTNPTTATVDQKSGPAGKPGIPGNPPPVPGAAVVAGVPPVGGAAGGVA